QRLLLVAAAELKNAGLEPGLVEPQGGSRASRGRALGRVRDEAEAGAAREPSDADVFQHAPERKHPLLLPVTGDEAHFAGPANFAGARMMRVEQRMQELLLPAPSQSGQADDLAAADPDFAVERSGEAAAHGQQRLARLLGDAVVMDGV